MNRREAVSRVALLMGGAVIGAEFFLSGCKNPQRGKGAEFTEDDQALLDEIGDTIMPATDTPGAKSVGIGAFMAMMVKDCYDEKNQNIFNDGIDKLNDAAKKQYDKVFMGLSTQQRTQFLNTLDKEQRDYTAKKKKEDPPHYFHLMKELTLLGYFTSELGCTKVLRYVETPGHYDGSLPYKKGDKAWATS